MLEATAATPHIEVRIRVSPQVIEDGEQATLIAVLGQVALNEARATIEAGVDRFMPPVEITESRNV